MPSVTVSAAVGPISHWPAEGNAEDVVDVNDGTLVNGATFATGRLGQAFSLNQINQTDAYVQIGAPPNLVMSSAVSILAWIYPTGLGSNGELGGIIVNKEGEYEVARFADGTIQWAFADTGATWDWSCNIDPTYVAPTVREETWRHIAVVYDSGYVMTYVNGELANTSNPSDRGSTGVIGDDIHPDLNDFRIGGRQHTAGGTFTQFFDGLIDEVMIYDVALSGDEIYDLYTLCGEWYQVQKKSASDGATDDEFSYSVSISGDTLVVGTPDDDDNGLDSGSAYVFERNQGGADSWGQVAKLTASDSAADDLFGYSVSISSDTLVVGAFGNDAYSGSAYVFERNQGGADSWGQVAKLTASDAASGDWFGYSVSISGDTLIIGAHENDDNGTNSGSAYVFERNQDGVDSWGQVAKLTASDAAMGDEFGYSVSISGDTLVVGAHDNDDDGTNSGSAYVFERNEGGADSWGQVAKLTASDAASGDLFGYSVSISGDTLVIGAHDNDDNGTESGSAYVFERNQGGADSWGQVAKLTASDAASGDWFGYSVSISGDTLVAGAWGDDDNGLSSGSAYVFHTICCEQMTINLAADWNTFLVPLDIGPDNNTLGDLANMAGLDIGIAYYLDGTTQTWGLVGADYVMLPCDAIYIKMNTAGSIPIYPNPNPTVPAKSLYNGWNLAGSAFINETGEMAVDEALISLYYAEGKHLPQGYSQVISPELNQPGWVYLRDGADPPDMLLGKGYLVAIDNTDEYLGQTYTPWPWLSRPIVVDISCDEFTENPHGLSDEFQVEICDKITVRLCSNPSTGSIWDYEMTTENVLIEEDYYFERPSGSHPGAPGTEVWTFKAVKKGTAEVQMEYGQPWEGGSKAVRTYTMTVTVE